MAYKTIVVQKGEGAVSHIILNRPQRRNALNSEMLEEIFSALWLLNESDDVKVIILRGEGQGFCAGAELNTLIAGQGVMDSKKKKSGLIDVLTAMSKIGKVIIAQVHGFALAGGFGLAAAADLTVIARGTKLGLPEIKRGIFAYNVMNPIARLMPQKFLLEMLFTGGNITTKEALAWGLANKITEPEDLAEETASIAQKIAAHSAAALSLGKESFYQMKSMDYYAAFNYLTGMLVLNSSTDDSKEGIAAFLEKRPPQWRGK